MSATNSIYPMSIFISFVCSAVLTALVAGEFLLIEILGGWGGAFINSISDKFLYQKIFQNAKQTNPYLFWILKLFKIIFLLWVLLLVLWVSKLQGPAFIIALFTAYFIFLAAHLYEINFLKTAEKASIS
jgi:hypothetical protein